MSISNQPAGTKESIEARRVKAFDLRKAGASYRQIAAQLGVSYVTVGNDIKAVLARLIKEQLTSAEQYRAMELERLDALQVSIWTRAIGNVSKGIPADLGAMDRIIKINESRRKLLGLDAPTKAEFTLNKPIDALSDAELAALAEGKQP